MTGRTITLTEHQFEELRTYEHGNPSWRPHKPNDNLIRRGMLDHVDGRTGFYRITTFGRDALAAFREKYGIHDEVSA